MPQVDYTSHATPLEHPNPNVNIERPNERSYEADKELAEVTNRGLDNLNSNNCVRHVRFGDQLDNPVGCKQAPMLLSCTTMELVLMCVDVVLVSLRQDSNVD